MDRRTFLFNSAAAALGAASAPALAQGASPRLPIRKAVEFTMLPKSLSPLERMRLAKECGFEAVEIGTQEDPRIAEEYKKASDQAGLPIHSVMNMAHWEFPLSSPKPEVVARSLKGMETSLENAKLWGAQTQRSLQHFSIGRDLIPREMITVYTVLKKSARSPTMLVAV